MRRKALIASLLTGAVLTTLTMTGADARGREADVARAFTNAGLATPWQRVAKIPLKFPTHHPQGFALVGDLIFMSTVEVTEAPVKYPMPVDGYDRSPGKGQGHVLVLDRTGKQLADIKVGEATMYHPGGIDFDGRSVWVSVAEYRPNSQTVVYKIDPVTHAVSEQFRVKDHIGGIVKDRRTGHLHGVSWGSRKFYDWTGKGKQVSVKPNPSLMVDYQDCDYVAKSKQLCSGVIGLPGPTGTPYEFGGIALLDLADDNRILKEQPFPAYGSTGHIATRNPLAFEVDGSKMRILAAPDDGDAPAGTELLIYEAPLPA